jgi:hypothetical protein
MENQIKTSKKLLCETMFKMFKDDYLPHLDMEDFIVMWQSLAYQWKINIDDDQWEEFTEEINSMASNRQSIFNSVFDKYFL